MATGGARPKRSSLQRGQSLEIVCAAKASSRERLPSPNYQAEQKRSVSALKRLTRGLSLFSGFRPHSTSPSTDDEPSVSPPYHYFGDSIPNLTSAHLFEVSSRSASVGAANTTKTGGHPPLRAVLSDNARLSKTAVTTIKTITEVEGGLQARSAPDFGVTRLNVPNIQVKSKSNASSPSTNSVFSIMVTERIQSVSSPNLHDKHIADMKLEAGNMERRLSVTLMPPEVNLRFSRFIAKVTEFIFISSVEAMYNEALLCRFDIERIVDITNVRPENVPRHRKVSTPCNCPLKRHCRPKFYLEIDNSETEIVEPYFDDINVFIHAACKAKKRILISSYDGNSRCALVAIEYLIKFCDMNFKEAFALVKSCRPSVCINAGFRKALERWEKKHRTRKSSETIPEIKEPMVPRPEPREAWK